VFSRFDSLQRFLLQVPEMGVAQNIPDAEEGTLEIGMGEYRFYLTILC